MAARFLALGSIFIKSRMLLILVGEAVEGEIVAGMTIKIPLHEAVSICAVIAEVNAADVYYGGQQHTGLVLEFGDEEDLELLSALRIESEYLAVDWTVPT